MPAINLGMPYTPDENWDTEAACRTRDPELWFPTDGSLGRFRAEQAKAICKTECPVRLECLAAGMDEDDGIWGGLDEKRTEEATWLTARTHTHTLTP